jgi:hypothetical protein
MKKLLIIYLAIFSIVLSVFSTKNPSVHWDAIGYVASALAYEIRDPEDLQKKLTNYSDKLFPRTITRF